MKNILIVTALAIASLSIASAKSYEMVLNTPATAGKTELSAGRYRIKVNSGYAEFLNLDNNHTIMVPVRVDTGNDRFDYTAVETKKENGVQQIQSIELQDTNSTLEF